MNNSVTTTVQNGSVTKTATNADGMDRIARECRILELLADAKCAAKLLEYSHDGTKAHAELEYIEGESLKDWLRLTGEWAASKKDWKIAQKRLAEYVEVEMKLLEHGVMYRDLNLEHVLFTNRGARIIDLEASLIGGDLGVWLLDGRASRRGTWETMALEEFRRPAKLTYRTATYRAAVVAHLVLTGELPFVRKPLRHDTHKWRKQHVPNVSLELPKSVRKVFTAALSREPAHRYKDPASLLAALNQSFSS